MGRLPRLPRAEGAPAEPAGDAALAAAARHDPRAFDLLFDRYADPVLNDCFYRLGAWEEAEDAAQQIFADAYAALARFDERGADAAGSFRAWLFTIAHHEVANRRRGLARRAASPLDAAAEAAATDPAPTDWVGHDQHVLWTPLAAPTGPTALRVERITLANDAVRELPAGGVLQLAVSPDAPGRLAEQSGFAVKNLGAAPATVYLLTLLAPNADANPAGTPAP